MEKSNLDKCEGGWGEITYYTLSDKLVSRIENEIKVNLLNNIVVKKNFCPVNRNLLRVLMKPNG